jgi:hypothetical protein
MGSCSFSVRKSRLFISLTESSAFFLNYKENLICRFAVDSISTVIRLGPSAKIPKHCAYTFHSPFLYILGGCDDENILKNEVFKVNIEEFSLEYLSTLPINSKHGDLYIQNDFLYLIGAVHLQNYSAMPTPFMRLSTGSNWEVLGENTKTSRNFSVSNHLLRPGSCRHGSSLYLIGGEIIKGKAEKVFNTNVYCLDLNTLVINLLDFEGPSLCSPKCIYLTSGLLVFGGFGENGFNREMFILGSKKLKINENSLKVSGNKAIHKINNHFYLFGTKRLKKLSEEKLTWKVEELGFEEHVMRLDIKTCLNQKKQPESTRRVSIFPMFSDEDKSNLGSLRQDSRKHSPSNFFNSQADFDYSQTIQKLSLKELSDINSIMEMSEFK